MQWSSHDSQLNIDYSAIQAAEAQDSPLQDSDEASLALLLKNGLRLDLRNGSIEFAASGLPSAAPTVTHSDTTVQVEGVDEGDAVKYDGATSTSWCPVCRRRSCLNSTRRRSKSRGPIRQRPARSCFRALDFKAINLSGSSSTVSLKAVPIRHKPLPLSAIRRVLFWPRAGRQHLSVASSRLFLDLLDVSDPTNVSPSWKLELEGNLRTSRQIGDTLYLITSHSPSLLALNRSATSEADRRSNERMILAAGVNDLLPHVWYADGSTAPLVNARDCLVPNGIASTDAYRELTVVTAINLRERRISGARCLSVSENGVFVSQNALYVGGSTRQSNTVLHKFALADGQSSIAVPASSTASLRGLLRRIS